MRISDWSSDVCSSDLVEVEKAVAALPAPETVEPREVDMDAVREIVDEMAQQAVSEQLPDAIKAIPVPEAPAPIEPDMEAIGKMIADGVAKAVKIGRASCRERVCQYV